MFRFMLLMLFLCLRGTAFSAELSKRVADAARTDLNGKFGSSHIGRRYEKSRFPLQNVGVKVWDGRSDSADLQKAGYSENSGVMIYLDIDLEDSYRALANKGRLYQVDKENSEVLYGLQATESIQNFFSALLFDLMSANLARRLNYFDKAFENRPSPESEASQLNEESTWVTLSASLAHGAQKMASSRDLIVNSMGDSPLVQAFVQIRESLSLDDLLEEASSAVSEAPQPKWSAQAGGAKELRGSLDGTLRSPWKGTFFTNLGRAFEPVQNQYQAGFDLHLALPQTFSNKEIAREFREEGVYMQQRRQRLWSTLSSARAQLASGQNERFLEHWKNSKKAFDEAGRLYTVGKIDFVRLQAIAQQHFEVEDLLSEHLLMCLWARSVLEFEPKH